MSSKLNYLGKGLIKKIFLPSFFILSTFPIPAFAINHKLDPKLDLNRSMVTSSKSQHLYSVPNQTPFRRLKLNLEYNSTFAISLDKQVQELRQRKGDILNKKCYIVDEKPKRVYEISDPNCNGARDPNEDDVRFVSSGRGVHRFSTNEVGTLDGIWVRISKTYLDHTRELLLKEIYDIGGRSKHTGY